MAVRAIEYYKSILEKQNGKNREEGRKEKE